MTTFLADIMSNPGVILALLVVVIGVIALTAFLLKKYVINPKNKKENKDDDVKKTKEDIAEEELNRAQQYKNEIGYHSNSLVNHTVNFPSLTSMNELIKKIIMGRFYKSQLYPNEKPYESNNLISAKSSNDETLTLSNKYDSSKDDK